MQRKQLLIAGIALVLLLLGGTALVLKPWEHSETSDSSRAPGSGVIETGGATVETVAAAPGDTVVMLTWEPVEGAAGYFVYRDGGKVPLNPTPLTETRYEDIGLSNGRIYSYEVAPSDAAGVPGKRSTEVNAAPGAR